MWLSWYVKIRLGMDTLRKISSFSVKSVQKHCKNRQYILKIRKLTVDYGPLPSLDGHFLKTLNSERYRVMTTFFIKIEKLELSNMWSSLVNNSLFYVSGSSIDSQDCTI